MATAKQKAARKKFIAMVKAKKSKKTSTKKGKTTTSKKGTDYTKAPKGKRTKMMHSSEGGMTMY